MQPIRPPLTIPRLRVTWGAATVIGEAWRYHLRSPHWRLYRNLDAGAWIEHPGGRYDLEPGRWTWLPSWGSFRSGCRGQVRHFFLHVDIDGLPGDGGWVDRPQPLPEDPVLTDLAARCQDGDHPWAMALAQAAFAAWMRTLTPAAVAALHAHHAGPDPLAPALSLVEERIAHPLPVGALAAACGFSDDTLARMMRTRLGCTPATWVRRRRCARASELLAFTETPIETIATAVGFTNRHHFSRIFAEEMHCGPAAYRRHARAWRD